MENFETATSVLKAAVGSSRDPQPQQAAIGALTMAKKGLGDLAPHLAIVFASGTYEHEPLLAKIREALPETHIIGGSTSGEITAMGLQHHSCVLMLLHAPNLRIGLGLGEDAFRQPVQAGRKATYAASKNTPPQQRRLFLVLSDGLMGNSALWLRGVQESLGPGCPILGAHCGDDLLFKQTSQFFETSVTHHSLVGALFSGPVSVGHGVTHGFHPITKPRRITQAGGFQLTELDKKPAASVYTEYFGEEQLKNIQYKSITRQGMAYPLGIQYDGSNEWVLRNVLNYTAEGALVCNESIPETAWVQIMISSRSLALDAVRGAARTALDSVEQPACAVFFVSFSRIKLMGADHVNNEIAAARHIIGANIPTIGFIGYGEHSPIFIDGSPRNMATQSGCFSIVTLGAGEP